MGSWKRLNSMCRPFADKYYATALRSEGFLIVSFILRVAKYRQNNKDLRLYLLCSFIKIPSLTLTSKLWAVRVFHDYIGADPSKFFSNYDFFKYVYFSLVAFHFHAFYRWFIYLQTPKCEKSRQLRINLLVPTRFVSAVAVKNWNSTKNVWCCARFCKGSPWL